MKEENRNINAHFTLDDSLVNEHYEEILDILGERLKTKKQIRNNKDKVLSLLKETFPDVTEEKLIDGFNIIYETVKDIPFKYDTIKATMESLNKFSLYVLEINDKFKDHGYSLLLFGYFWLTRNY